MARSIVGFIVVLVTAGMVVAAPIDGNGLAIRTNSNSLVAPGVGPATLTENGYVGTYIDVPVAGKVKIRVNAMGTGDGGTDAHMNIVIGDEVAGWDVGATPGVYKRTFDLPAGKHFVRTELNNDRGTLRSLTVNTFEVVSGATVDNNNTNANALAAADTYIENGRKGGVKLKINPSIAAPGTEVQVKLVRHAFNFGTTMGPNVSTDTFLLPNPAPGSNSAFYQQALIDNRFNSLAAENAAKWASNEGTRDVLAANAANPNGGPNIPLMDRLMDFAEENGLRYRAHNLIWGRNGAGGVNQQPGWTDAMLQNPAGIDAVSGDSNFDALRDEISERIDYYVTDRGHRYYEIDVYNESWHTGSNQNIPPNLPATDGLTYWEVYGTDGIAGIYKEVKDALAAIGQSDVGVYVNEFNVLQNMSVAGFGTNDYFANWYTRHIESLQNSGQAQFGEDVVSGIGYQYYASSNLNSHNAARIMAVMQNLAVQGLSMHLTEWGTTGSATGTTFGVSNEQTAATILNETARLVFGMASNTGITLWNLYNHPEGVFAPAGTLYNTDWTPRQTAAAWQLLMDAWDTQETLTVGGDGTINFDGFFGDYEIIIGDETYDVETMKGRSNYRLVPEPASIALLGLGGTMLAARRRNR